MKYLKYILEKSFQDIDEIEIVNHIIENIEYDSAKKEMMVAQFIHEEGWNGKDFKGIDDDEIFETKEFKDWLQYEIEYRYGDLKDKFSKLKNEYFEVEIFREMKVKSTWFKTLKNPTHLGIYWSYKKDAAEAYWGYSGEVPVLISAKVKFDLIDWKETFLANLDVNIGEMEKEIRLVEDTIVKVEEILFNKQIIKVPNIKFLA